MKQVGFLLAEAQSATAVWVISSPGVHGQTVGVKSGGRERELESCCWLPGRGDGLYFLCLLSVPLTFRFLFELSPF